MGTKKAEAETSGEWAMKIAKTPVGRVWLIAHRDKIWGAELEPRWPQLAERLLAQHGINSSRGEIRGGPTPILAKAEKALDRYFEGDLEAPGKIELDLEGSSLQRKVWSVVRRVPPGRTITYKQLATKVRQAGAFRAVGAANGANRCAIFVPCHRVVGSEGTLQGYGAGIEVKAKLLEHEGVGNDGWRLD